MLYQVNYKYVHANGKIRSAQLAVEAPNDKEARKLATTEIKKEFDHFEITSSKPFSTN